jgi:hypothetical protein
MSDNQERVVTLTTTELLNFASHHVTQENLNETRKELDAKIESVRTDLSADIQAVRTDLTKEIQAVRTDLTKEIQTVRTDLTKEMNNIFYKLVILMMGTVGGLFGAMIYVLNNFYNLQP